jgi:hypothetical protein
VAAGNGGGVIEIALAIFFIQPYPTHYVGTVPYCVALGLIFGGWNMLLLASRARRLAGNPGLRKDRVRQRRIEQAAPDDVERTARVGRTRVDRPRLDARGFREVQGTASADHRPLHRRRRPRRRYLHGARRAGIPEGIYISLYPAVEIDRSPDDFTRLLRATQENNVPGRFQPDYPTESKAWCPSTVQVRIRNYDAERLQNWHDYRQNTTYNLTHRNCSSTVARARCRAGGAATRAWTRLGGWWPLFRLLLTPELWVAAHLRKRAATMAWTPGLTLDYARAMSMLADPRPFAWATVCGVGWRWRSGRESR